MTDKNFLRLCLAAMVLALVGAAVGAFLTDSAYLIGSSGGLLLAAAYCYLRAIHPKSGGNR